MTKKLREFIDEENLILDNEKLKKVEELIRKEFDQKLDELHKYYITNQMEYDCNLNGIDLEKEMEIRKYTTFIKDNI